MSSVGYRQLLREQRDFRRLWFGDIASFLGDWFNLIAIYTSVQAITSSPLAVAAVVVTKTLPNFFMIPIAGPLVDRFDRRKLLLTCDFARAACVLGLIASHRAGSLLGLYGCTLLMIVFTAIAFPAKKAALPMLVPRERISAANALAGGTWSIMLAIGAALGGAAVHYLGVTASFGIDAVSFLVSAMFFARLPSLIPPAGESGGDARFIDAIRYLRRTPYVQALTCIKPFGSFANSVVLAVIPVYAATVFPGESGPLYMGALYMSRGAGAAVGSLVLRIVFGDSPRALRRLIASGYLMMFAGLSLAAQSGVFWLIAAGFFLSAVGSGGNWVVSGTLLQLEADKSYHGRIFSLEFGVTTLVLAGGSVLVGFVQDHWGVSASEVTQWWAMLTLPPAMFWIGTLVVMRRRVAREIRSAPPLQPVPPV
jgi:MFS family permease